MIDKSNYHKSIGRYHRPLILVAGLCTFLVMSALPASVLAATVQTVGATTPFTTIEGEAGTLGGGAVKHVLQTIPANALSSPELEASGRSYVELAAPGSFVSWINPVDSDNTINIRECIPDAPGGGGIDATLDLYINGTLRQAIPLTSRQTWVYDGTNGNNNGMTRRRQRAVRTCFMTSREPLSPAPP